MLDVELPPYALWCIRLSDALPAVERAPVYESAETPRLSWQVSRAIDDAAARFEAAVQKVDLEDWRRWPKMESYAGAARYRATLTLAVGTDSAVAIDAGRVEEIAELTVNGKALGVRLHQPYQWDITQAPYS